MVSSCRGSLVVTLVVTSCVHGGEAPSPSLEPLPSPPKDYLVANPILPADDKAPVIVSVDRDEAHVTNVTRQLVAWTTKTIIDPEFQKFVATYHAAKGRREGDVVDGKDLLWEYLGASVVRKPASRDIEILGASYSATASTGVYPKSGEVISRVFLRTPVIDRADDRSVEVRACAVNTLAHEWVHTIPNETGNGSFYLDGGHKGAIHPLASYELGSAAQCVYLKRYGYPDLDIPACVQRVGTTIFNAASCTPGWAATVQPPVPPPPQIAPTDFWPKLDAVCASIYDYPSRHNDPRAQVRPCHDGEPAREPRRVLRPPASAC